MSRRKDREQAFLLLFEEIFLKGSLDEVLKTRKNICDFAKCTFEGIKKNKTQIEKIIDENVDSWNKERLPKIVFCVLKLAIYEIFFDSSIALNVSINEAIELCKKYGVPKDASFVNAVLGKVVSKKEAKQ